VPDRLKLKDPNPVSGECFGIPTSNSFRGGGFVLLIPFLLFLAGLAGTLLLTPLMIKNAPAWGAMDPPGERKIHQEPIARLGGLAIFMTVGLVGGAAMAIQSQMRVRLTDDIRFWGALAGGATIVFFLGLYDDIRGARVWVKFAIQLAAALLLVFMGGIRVSQVTNPFGGSVDIGWMAVPLTVVWIVGVTNAFNLIDGLDGLAGGIAFISIATIFLISIVGGGRSLVVVTTALLAGSVLGFLKYNFHPARIFLGDCGSMFLGYLMAGLSVVGSNKRTTALALLIPILIVGIPVFDTLNAMVRRLARQLFIEENRSPRSLLAMFSADRAHIHHILIERGFSHRNSVLILYGMALFFSLLALVAVLAESDRISFGLMLVGFIGFVVMRHFGQSLPLNPFKRTEGDLSGDKADGEDASI
jgi:UDP-GlcNAc:undecaprenyl-phosphate/decaprenyl-phosphate GlcNAc-1-phosphate transferase